MPGQHATHLLEVGAGGEDLVDEVFDGEDVVLAKGLLNDLVVGEGDSLLVDLAVTALVNQLADGLEVGLAGKKKNNQRRTLQGLSTIHTHM